MTFYIILFVVIGIAVYFFMEKKAKSDNSKKTDTTENKTVAVVEENKNKTGINYKTGYKRKNFMTERERDFYNSIEKIIDREKYFISCQVRCVDIIEPMEDRNDEDFLKKFRSFSQYHIDYVIVRKTDFFVVCAIELDDSSHNSYKRAQRDKKVNFALEGAGIYFIRSKYKNTLLQKISSKFGYTGSPENLPAPDKEETAR